MAVRVGTKFRSSYKDSNPEWKVIGSRGKGAWDCVITEESLDWAGARKVFGTEEIERSLAFDRAFSRMVSSADKWWSERKLGEVLHYHNGFGEYVRGVVINSNGINKLLPTAMVGNWPSRDLPRRNEDGSVTYGYHVKKVRFPDGNSAWQPNTGCIWEHESFVGNPRFNTDPTTMPEIDLSDPPMFIGEAAVKARLLQMGKEITEIIAANRETPAVGMDKVAEFIKLEYEPFKAAVSA